MLADVVDYVSSFDVIALQETHTLADQPVPWPKGYKVFSRSRAIRPDLGNPGGGVAILVRNTLPCRLRQEYGGDDIVTVQIEDSAVVNIYMPPENSPDLVHRDVQPTDRLLEIVSGLRAEGITRIVVVGDCNARTAMLQALRGAPRCTEDMLANARGRAVVEVADIGELSILNGTHAAGPTSGLFTSHQHNGTAVVDYVLISTACTTDVARMHVNTAKVGVSDHAPLELHLNCSLAGIQCVEEDLSLIFDEVPLVPRARRPIDDLLHDVLRSRQSDDEARSALYGPVWDDTPEVRVWTDGSTKEAGTTAARSGAGIYWGEDCKRNLAARIAGPQRNNRAELVAFAAAVGGANPDRTLHVYTDSGYTCGMLGPWVPRHAQLDWRGTANGDVMRNLCSLIQLRSCPLHVTWVKAHAGNTGNNRADGLAREGADKPLDTAIDGTTIRLAHQPADRTGCCPLAVPKVVVEPPPDLPNEPLDDTESMHSEDDARSDVDTDSTDHSDAGVKPRVLGKRQRRRQRVRETRRANRERLVKAAGKPKFWLEFKELADRAQVVDEAPPDKLQPVFLDRMNAPVAAVNDTARRRLVDALARLLPATTIDESTERWFSRAWTVDDIAAIKYAVTQHGLGSASGWEDVTYEYVLAIPNEKLLELFNRALYTTESPGDWLTTILIGVLKRGKASDNPENYRTIGLECVLLRMLTLLMDRRIREWAEARSILPASQNGFRPGFRTNNNAFILRCAAERAASQGKKLYVASVDLANAFPSVDRPLLWLKLQAMGFQGPLLDLYRLIYDNMSYVVRGKGGFAAPFSSNIGVLIGDPASPIMWNLFFADFSLPPRPDDIRLAGLPVSHLEHADDVIIFSTTTEGLQSHLRSLAGWGTNAFVTINVDKTWALEAGGSSAYDVFLHLNNRRITLESCATYVGMHMSSTNPRLFHAHYEHQAQKARKAAAMCYAVESLTGSLPLQMVKTVYSGRVDPHLIAGHDVCPDAVTADAERLETVQRAFLRRMLGLGPRSCLSPLFSETGIWPIRVRRATLCLDFLKYCRNRPPHELVHYALEDSIALARLNCLSWFGDLQTATAFVGGHLPHGAVLSDDLISLIQDSIRRTMLASLNADFAASPRLYLLRGQTPGGRLGRAGTTLALREYLTLDRKSLRRALLRILVSDHNLAVETLRHASRDRLPVPRDLRLCRFCRTGVEDEIHAMFICAGDPALLLARQRFAKNLWERGLLQEATTTTQTEGYVSLVQFLLKNKDRAALLAKLARDVMRTFDTAPLLRLL